MTFGVSLRPAGCFLPETKGVPLEEMTLMWSSHWFWKKIVPQSDAFKGAR